MRHVLCFFFSFFFHPKSLLNIYKRELLTTQVVGNACGDRSDEIQAGNLFDLNAKYADVVSEEDAIAHLSQKWQ